MTCTSCSRTVPPGSRFCPHCAAPADPASLDFTRTSAPHGNSSSEPSDHGRFLPGTMLGGRYRVVGLLGRGGMGEVYRADDLKLGQAVALKFLPTNVEKDASRLQRFLNEVKIARQISHPNVCRVYDVGEVEGHHYLSMEYVDGEDLASLLRRIGRLPTDKAVQLSREMCMGLAAAHEQGILHRDLKPANVMIDGRGRAKIADFGLATIAREIDAAEVGAGTPGYMAPEQRAGTDVTVRSDIYSLGLVLYELFTGQPAFKAATPAELARLQEESRPTSPGLHVDGLDATIERAILRCLEKEPGRRPVSALAVAASLPGGDALAVALAAGETPSPEMVADAGDVGGLTPAVALACLGALVVGVALVIALSSKTQVTGIVSAQNSPEALAERARAIIRTLGHDAVPADSASGFALDERYLDYLAEHDKSPTRWDRLSNPRPPLLAYWYRESPRYLVPGNATASVGMNDPPQLVSGMVQVTLDAQGHLWGYQLVPPERDESKGPWPEPDWSALFKEAGLEPAEFKPVEPAWLPVFFVDRRSAWEGSYSGSPDFPIRIEAAAYRGKPAFFKIAPPWVEPTRMLETPRSLLRKVSTATYFTVNIVCLVIGVFLARRNLRLGRGDRKGAMRISAFLLAARTLTWLFLTHHVAELSEVNLFFATLGSNLFDAVAFWIFYIALEPYLRRLWPHMIVSWVRLLDGRFRDPLVGRDVLFGLLAGIVPRLLGQLFYLGSRWAGLMTPAPRNLLEWNTEIAVLGGLHRSIAALADAAGVLVIPLLIMMCLLLLRLLLRRQWLAMAAFVPLTALFSTPSSFAEFGYFAVVNTIFLVMIFRVGFVAVVASFFTAVLLVLPMTFNISAWYGANTVVVVAAIAGLAGWSFHVSLAGRPLFRNSLLEH